MAGKAEIDIEGAKRFFDGSGSALSHFDALVTLGPDTSEEVTHTLLGGLTDTLKGFSKADMISGLDLIIRAASKDQPTQLESSEE